MTQERTETEVRGLSPSILTQDELAAETKAQRRARLINVLDRGVMHDRLYVKLPDNMHGEWARNKPEDIMYMQTLGFKVDDEFAPKRSLNANGDGKSAVIGDVIFMTCPRELKEEIDAIRLEQFYAKNGKPGENSVREEREFEKATKATTGGEIQTSVESTTRPATVSDVVSAIKAADAQMTPIL